MLCLRIFSFDYVVISTDYFAQLRHQYLITKPKTYAYYKDFLTDEFLTFLLHFYFYMDYTFEYSMILHMFISARHFLENVNI